LFDKEIHERANRRGSGSRRTLTMLSVEGVDSHSGRTRTSHEVDGDPALASLMLRGIQHPQMGSHFGD